MGKAGSDSKATRRAAIAARCKSPMEMLFSHIQRRRLESRVLYIHTKYTQQQRHTHTRRHTATHTYAYTRQKMREKSMIIGYTSTDSRQKGCHTHTHSLDTRSMCVWECVWECVCVTVRASAFCVCLGQKSETETETRMRTRTETVAES